MAMPGTIPTMWERVRDLGNEHELLAERVARLETMLDELARRLRLAEEQVSPPDEPEAPAELRVFDAARGR